MVELSIEEKKGNKHANILANFGVGQDEIGIFIDTPPDIVVLLSVSSNEIDSIHSVIIFTRIFHL